MDFNFDMDLAAIADALKNQVPIVREIVAPGPDGEWRTISTIYRGSFTASWPADEPPKLAIDPTQSGWFARTTTTTKETP